MRAQTAPLPHLSFFLSSSFFHRRRDAAAASAEHEGVEPLLLREDYRYVIPCLCSSISCGPSGDIGKLVLPKGMQNLNMQLCDGITGKSDLYFQHFSWNWNCAPPFFLLVPLFLFFFLQATFFTSLSCSSSFVQPTGCTSFLAFPSTPLPRLSQQLLPLSFSHLPFTHPNKNSQHVTAHFQPSTHTLPL